MWKVHTRRNSALVGFFCLSHVDKVVLQIFDENSIARKNITDFRSKQEKTGRKAHYILIMNE
jgi:hypothetical protein